MLREDTAQRTTHSVKTPDGGRAHDPSKIAEAFHSFFSKLYSLPETLPADRGERSQLLENCLSSCQMPKLPSDALTQMNAPVTPNEVGDVLKALPTGKAPGPDGLTYLYYQTFSDLLCPHMTSPYNSFLSGNSISDALLHSYITLIPKPGKDPTDCADYRPIALLNADLKVFTKILANRLALWLPQLIYKDQVGFVPCRQGGDNTRRAIDLIDILNKRKETALLLSLDAEKAFDRLNWSFMFAVLELLGFAGPFVLALRSLYSGPSAVIRLPHAMSKPIIIKNDLSDPLISVTLCSKFPQTFL